MQLQTQPLLAVNQAGAVVATHDLSAGAFIGQYTGQVSLYLRRMLLVLDPCIFR